ncbi:MAG: hypothetical protein H0X29_03880 [Parachlamydiaceae bacterium]|nr:hypothetical protein [Parachlamydiaceae bacterium]
MDPFFTINRSSQTMNPFFSLQDLACISAVSRENKAEARYTLEKYPLFSPGDAIKNTESCLFRLKSSLKSRLNSRQKINLPPSVLHGSVVLANSVALLIFSISLTVITLDLLKVPTDEIFAAQLKNFGDSPKFICAVSFTASIITGALKRHFNYEF